MNTKPLYLLSYSRDFNLINIEIWWRGEVLNNKIWTDEVQPFKPYIVFEKTSEIVDCFYNPKGILWIKEKLADRIKSDKNFLSEIEKQFTNAVESLRGYYKKSDVLDHLSLCEYLEIYEKGYVWFEAAWWIWDMDNQQLAREYITEHFRCLRENTQDFVPASENIINNSLRAIYPELGDLAGVLRIDEVKSNKIPTTQELEMRQKGYFFVDNHIYTNNSRKFIEDKYNLMLQTFDEKSVDSITGVVAYGGSNVLIGKVSVVKNIKDFEKVRSGDILVSPMTLPNFLPIIKLSSAIITDEGGALCHAAIVSREMKKPCIIGTKIATKVLKDGDLVEVDANHGVVKILKRA